jgi:hypothetical protein
MDAALEVVRALRGAGYQEMAALKDSGAGDLQIRETSLAFRSRILPAIQDVQKNSAELLYLGERVRLAALIYDFDDGSPF